MQYWDTRWGQRNPRPWGPTRGTSCDQAPSNEHCYPESQDGVPVAPASFGKAGFVGFIAGCLGVRRSCGPQLKGQSHGRVPTVHLELVAPFGKSGSAWALRPASFHVKQDTSAGFARVGTVLGRRGWRRTTQHGPGVSGARGTAGRHGVVQSSHLPMSADACAGSLSHYLFPTKGLVYGYIPRGNRGTSFRLDHVLAICVSRETKLSSIRVLHSRRS